MYECDVEDEHEAPRRRRVAARWKTLQPTSGRERACNHPSSLPHLCNGIGGLGANFGLKYLYYTSRKNSDHLLTLYALFINQQFKFSTESDCGCAPRIGRHRLRRGRASQPVQRGRGGCPAAAPRRWQRHGRCRAPGRRRGGGGCVLRVRAHC